MDGIVTRAGIRLTHADRVVFPDQGLTKGDLAAYYESVAALMLPHIVNRPLSLVRCPAGSAKCFFQKHNTGGFPEAMHDVTITEASGKKASYFTVSDLAGVIAGVQMNVLEFHIWGSRVDNIEKPDRLVFDLDPDVGLPFADVRDAARDIAERLRALGLESLPMLSGGKGVHVVVPLKRRAAWPKVKAFSKSFTTALEADFPDRYVANMAKAKRSGRIFVDYLRNERGSTAIAPYSTRRHENAPIATPLTWEELRSVEAANTFTVKTPRDRLEGGGDPWSGYFDIEQSITDAIVGQRRAKMTRPNDR